MYYELGLGKERNENIRKVCKSLNADFRLLKNGEAFRIYIKTMDMYEKIRAINTIRQFVEVQRLDYIKEWTEGIKKLETELYDLKNNKGGD